MLFRFTKDATRIIVIRAYTESIIYQKWRGKALPILRLRKGDPPGLEQVDCQDLLLTSLMQVVLTTCSKSASIKLQQV